MTTDTMPRPASKRIADFMGNSSRTIENEV